tara:strand:- start:1524 stop:1628 length:105 start_codon:yes stop_codon:yes gene_type:complete
MTEHPASRATVTLVVNLPITKPDALGWTVHLAGE